MMKTSHLRKTKKEKDRKKRKEKKREPKLLNTMAMRCINKKHTHTRHPHKHPLPHITHPHDKSIGSKSLQCFYRKNLDKAKKNKTADAERYNVKKNHEFPKYRTKKE